MPLRLSVPVEDEWRGRDTVQVFTDQGDGTVDGASPILAKALEAFGNVSVVRGWGRNPWGRESWGSLRPVVSDRRSWGRGPWGIGGWGESPASVEVLVFVNEGHGDYLFTVKAIDEAGNEQDETPIDYVHHVAGTDPVPLDSFAFASFAADVVTFNVT